MNLFLLGHFDGYFYRTCYFLFSRFFKLILFFLSPFFFLLTLIPYVRIEEYTEYVE